MLVFSRRIGETVMIGPDIEVTVLKVQGSIVRLGFTAPLDVPVHRREVYERADVTSPVTVPCSCNCESSVGAESAHPFDSSRH